MHSACVPVQKGSPIVYRRAMIPSLLIRKIRNFPERPPFTTDFECILQIRRRWSRTGVWYGSQKQHWLGWLREYYSEGAYNRKTFDHGAEFAYNHLLCPPMVLWLAEASGIPKEKLVRAMKAALSAPSSRHAQCAAIRKVVPWELIETGLRRKAWEKRAR
jgi:hypothetical protein